MSLSSTISLQSDIDTAKIETKHNFCTESVTKVVLCRPIVPVYVIVSNTSTIITKHLYAVDSACTACDN